MALDVIGEFVDQWAILAGQAHTPFTLDNVDDPATSDTADNPTILVPGDYPTLWHAIYVHKTRLPGQRAFIMQATTGFEAERRARGVQQQPGWHTRIWRAAAVAALAAKFDQSEHPDRVKVLLSTGTAELVDGNSDGRRFWGVCRCGKLTCAGGGGDNHLGLLLMDLRAELAGHPE